MTATYVHDGNAIDYTPEDDTPSGSVVVLSDLVGITTRPLKADESGSLHVVGVFEFPKVTADIGAVFEVGQKAYWDATSELAVNSDGGGTHNLIGKAVQAAGLSDTSVRIRLSP